MTDAELDKVFIAFKDLADKKGEIDDRDLDALVSGERRAVEDVYKLDLLQVSCGNQLIPTATVRLIGPDGKEHRRIDRDGPGGWAFEAINASACRTADQYIVNSVTEGIDAGVVTVPDRNRRARSSGAVPTRYRCGPAGAPDA
jgi:2-isopropylmalate synthase